MRVSLLELVGIETFIFINSHVYKYLWKTLDSEGLKLDKHRISDLDKTEFDHLKWSKILPTSAYFYIPNENKTFCKLFR